MGFSDDQYKNRIIQYLKSIDISLGRIATALENNQVFPNPFNPVHANKSVIDAINDIPNSEVADTIKIMNRSCAFCKNGGGEFDIRSTLCHTCGREHENFDPIER